MAWDSKRSDLVTIDSANPLLVRPATTECKRCRFAVTNRPLPDKGLSYFEIKFNHNNGCYDSIGVVNREYSRGMRLGEDKNGWAVRVYGRNSRCTLRHCVFVS